MFPSTLHPWRGPHLWLTLAVVLLPWLAATGVTGWKVAQCLEEIWQGRASLAWQTASGKVDHAQLRILTGGRGGKAYEPALRYHYEAGGRVWHSARVEATPNYSQMQAQAVVKQFPAGASVTVYHNGKGLSALRRGVRPMTYIALFLWSLGAWLMGAMAWRQARRIVRREREGD
ncbi:MAG: DUF3592 domain-containing protein [Pseudomonadota bacterium]